MAEIKWAGPAFRRLQTLALDVAYQIINRVDQLKNFPLMGRGLRRADDAYRLLIVRQRFRVAYRYDKDHAEIFILALQPIRDQTPSLLALRQIEKGEEKP